MARIYHPDNNPDPNAAEKFHILQDAYMEAMNHAIPGPDPNQKKTWKVNKKGKTYSKKVIEPEYTKVIEAEDVIRLALIHVGSVFI